jgi:phage shock protein A
MAPGPPVPRPGSESLGMFPDLNAAYCRHLETLARVRRSVSVVATSRKRLEKRLSQIEREGAGQASSEIEAMRRQLDDERAEERRATEASQRLQARIDALRIAKLVVEAACLLADEAAMATLAEVTGS